MLDLTPRLPIALLAVTVAVAACHDSTGSHATHLTHPGGDSIVSVPLPGRPHGVAVAASGTFCISEIDADSVACGNLDTPQDSLSITSTVKVGSAPAHVALSPSGDTAYTADQFGVTMSVVDVEEHALVGSVRLSDGGFNVLVAPTGARVYVTTASGILHVVNAADLQVIATVPVGAEANGLAYDATRNRLYVSSISAGTITAIDPVADTVTRTYTVGGGPQRIAVAPDAGELYIASQQYGLQVLTLSNGEVATVAGVQPGSVGLALSPDEAQLYVTNPPAGVVYIVDRAGRRVLDSLTDMGSPRNVAFDETGAIAVITDETGFVHVVR
jgi:YVTN family beta-propeller protein